MPMFPSAISRAHACTGARPSHRENREASDVPQPSATCHSNLRLVQLTENATASLSAVHSSTVPRSKDRYTSSMQTNYLKGTLVAGWALALSTMAIVTDITRPASWFALAVVGAVPALVVLRLWQTPARSTSERIQEVLR